jgi:hypothetical protein
VSDWDEAGTTNIPQPIPVESAATTKVLQHRPTVLLPRP